MKKSLMASVLLIISLLFSACGTKVPFKVTKPLDNSAIVYVYVVDGMSSGEEASHSEYNILINGKRYLERIESGEYMLFNLKANPTLISVVKSQIIEDNIKLNLKAGDINYLRITDNTDSGEFGFEQVKPSEARQEISKTGLAGSSLENPENIITELIGLDDKKTENIATAMNESQIDAIIEKKLKSKGISVEVPVATSNSMLDKIKEAYEMKKQGILSDDEFKALKADILAK